MKKRTQYNKQLRRFTDRVRVEEDLRIDFLEEVHEVPGGERIRECIQCGTCSGTCPLSWAMFYTPRRLFAMIRGGMRHEVLSSNTIWMCSSCYMCAVRCPQDIKITDIMYALKNIAIREDYAKYTTAPILSQAFLDMVNKYGRNHETELMIKFLIRAGGLKRMLSMAPIGWALFSKGRLPFKANKIENIKQLHSIIKKAEELGKI